MFPVPDLGSKTNGSFHISYLEPGCHSVRKLVYISQDRRHCRGEPRGSALQPTWDVWNFHGHSRPRQTWKWKASATHNQWHQLTPHRTKEPVSRAQPTYKTVRNKLGVLEVTKFWDICVSSQQVKTKSWICQLEIWTGAKTSKRYTAGYFSGMASSLAVDHTRAGPLLCLSYTAVQKVVLKESSEDNWCQGVEADELWMYHTTSCFFFSLSCSQYIFPPLC